VLLVASDISQDYWLGSSPTQVGAGEQDTGIRVPLEDELVWAGGAVAGQTRVPARVFTGSMARPRAASWMTPAMHHPGGQYVGPHPRTAGGLP
jgi:hypothetical protein